MNQNKYKNYATVTSLDDKPSLKRTMRSQQHKTMQDFFCRVMVVDDNADAAQTLCWMLEMKGHECRFALDGSSALKISAEFCPEFVFLDLGMPKMNGYDLCHEMQKIPELEHTIFIAQTGWSDKEYIESARQAGFHRYIVKPFNSEEIELAMQ